MKTVKERLKKTRKPGSGAKMCKGITKLSKLNNQELVELISKYKFREIGELYNINTTTVSNFLSRRKIFKADINREIPRIEIKTKDMMFSENEMDYGRGMSQKQWILLFNIN